MGESYSFLNISFRRHTSFFSKISTGKTTDILPRLSSRPILDADGSVSASLHTDTLKDILLAKSAVLSSYNTYCDISHSTQYSRLS